ncbi:alpha/beta hydrolase [Streptomyces sp. NPDC002328]|uniref:alpha/beta hydrolase n=1 Tax=Streptomyces sp. NPDC002328 TaxID=3364642 RepID=UPI003696230E
MSQDRARWPRRVRAVAVAACTAALAVALPGSAGAKEPTAAAAQEIAWADCGEGAVSDAQCAAIQVPLDWRKPAGKKITLALSRLPARDPEHRIGPLLFNPGGPGGSGAAVVAYSDLLTAAPEFEPLRDRFDLIGFDPRGVGSSTPVTCPAPLHDPAVGAFPGTPAAYATLKRFNRAAGKACRAATGPLIDHVDTASVVSDVEALRRALGAEKISWLGLSYGTEIGSLYAQRHPNRVRTMVLDGVVDHTLPARRAAVDEARATEQALLRFARWCHDAEQCALRGTDAVAVYDAVLARADAAGIPAAGLGRHATAEELANGAYTYLTQPATWPLLAGALAAASGQAGDADASHLVAPASFLQPEYKAYRTVGCHDFAPDTRGFSDLRAQAARLRAVAPHTWRYSEFWDWTSGCLGWPVPAANPPAPLKVRGAPPILLVNTRFDPATPYPWAQRLTSRIDGGRLLTVEGDGHTGILNSSCARAHEAAYLVTGKTPAPGTTCAASPSAAVAGASADGGVVAGATVGGGVVAGATVGGGVVAGGGPR